MSAKKFTRREILQLGTRFAGAAILSTTFLPKTLMGATLQVAPSVFNVLDHGAKGDGRTLDTDAIQRTIDAAAKAGNGARVLLPSGYKFLTGTLELKSNIDFHLEGGAELIVSTRKKDYSGVAVLMAQGAVGLRITGTGNINGRAKEFMQRYDKKNEWWIPGDWRPKIFVLTECKDLQVRDISFSEAPFWGLHMLGCEKVLVDNLKVHNLLNVPNCDGIDPDHCRHVEIRNCHIVCGDDAIVVKATRQDKDYGPSSHITVKDCVFKTQDAGVKIGTETTQDIHDIRFERCEIHSSCRGLGIQLRDEGNVYNIDFQDINLVSRYQSDPWWGRGEAISFTAIPRTRETKLGSLHHIRVRNVRAKSENSIRVNGTKESIIHDVLFENVDLTMDRWTSYPGGLFDNRPTKVYPGIEKHDNPGFSIRYADDVSIKNCSVHWGDNRPEYYTNALEASHARNLKITEFEGESAHPQKFSAILIK